MKKLMNILLLSCLKATELMEKKLHIEISFKEKIQLKMHTTMCGACKKYEQQNILLDKLLKNKNSNKLNIKIEEFKSEIKSKINK